MNKSIDSLGKSNSYNENKEMGNTIKIVKIY